MNIISNLDKLIQDPYGNYLVQNVIKLKRDDLNGQIIEFIKKQIIMLSKQKFSSNVIEKCFEFTDAYTRGFLMEGLDLKGIVRELIADQFGNYVIQRMLKYNKHNHYYSRIIKEIGANVEGLQSTNNGRKIFQNLVKNHPDLAQWGSGTTYSELDVQYNK